MKFSTSLTVALAPLSMAGRVRRAASFAARSNHLVEEKAPEHVVAPVELALEQERRVTAQINELTKIAREESDFASDQFMQWFIREQVEEVASMNNLLTVVRRATEDPMRAEEFLAREQIAQHEVDAAAPATIAQRAHTGQTARVTSGATTRWVNSAR